MLADGALTGIRPGVIVLNDSDGKPIEVLIWELGRTVDVQYKTVGSGWCLAETIREPPIC